MKITPPTRIVETINRWNENSDSLTRFALTHVLREELMLYVNMIDADILPLYKKSVIEKFKGLNKKA